MILIRNICLALPEANEHIDGFGHNTFKINGKSFVITGESEEGFSLSFKSDRETQELLLQKEKRVSIQNPDREDWDELTYLIQEGYLRAAPKRMVKKWNELNKK